ncbi:hypothetical protein GOZ90_17275 [Agrobacterium vitis]|uniref:Uncharacterized protein n=1 Tax=Agrobacterium vitis TaxID=373 RepID=A0A6L6VLY5_AGRVI|nr:hypothetical protein [Agrobacterium vitis]MUZ74442.1 hypothetical protein [Agrobacterium vitis]
MRFTIRSYATTLALLIAIIAGTQAEATADSSQYEVAILKVSSTVS